MGRASCTLPRLMAGFIYLAEHFHRTFCIPDRIRALILCLAPSSPIYKSSTMLSATETVKFVGDFVDLGQS